MDVKQYYKKLRELEATMSEPYGLVVSSETPDGGRAGVLTEVPRRVACQLLLEGRARCASASEAEAYRQNEAAKREAYKHEQAASRIQFNLVPAAQNQPVAVKTVD